MAKQGMERHDRINTNSRNDVTTVSEIQGKAKRGNDRANPIIASTGSPALKIYHTVQHGAEKSISKAYPVIDNDLARDNLENDITAADLQDL